MKPSLRIIIGNLGIGGTERHLSQILPLLASKGYVIRVITLTPNPEHNFSDLLENSGVKVLTPPKLSFLGKLPKLIRKTFRLMFAMSYLFFDYIRDRKSITHYFLPEAYLVGMCTAILSFSRSPKVMSRRSLNNYQIQRPLLTYVEHFFHNGISAALGNSQSVVQQLLIEGISKQKVRLIYNGIDLKPFEKIRPRSEVRVSLGLKDTQLVLIYVANLIPYKGHKDLIEALNLVNNALPTDWHLLCAGRNENLLPQLKELVQQYNLEQHISWLGVRDDIPDLMKASDIGLLCSHEEGFSNAILEGMVASLPMIVTDVGGNPEAIVHNETGYVVPPSDPQKLSEAILRLALNPEKVHAFGKAGYQRACSTFTIERCVSKYDRLYKDISAPTLVEEVI